MAPPPLRGESQRAASVAAPAGTQRGKGATEGRGPFKPAWPERPSVSRKTTSGGDNRQPLRQPCPRA
ncbi:unnamed protein product [Merluccius merluccius]